MDYFSFYNFLGTQSQHSLVELSLGLEHWKVKIVANPIKLFFLSILIFAVKLGNFIISEFYLYLQTCKLNSKKWKKSSLEKKKVL
jgi:hypothetical protein